MNSLDYLLSFQRFGIKLGLDNITRLLQSLGNPHLKYPVIHVAGTNGKGSVVAFLHTVLATMGYKVGRFISPHLVDFSERIVVNDNPITDLEIDALVENLRPCIEGMLEDPQFEHPTFFEAVTAMAFQHFEKHEVDFAIVEVGMGGRYDSTNTVDPCLTVINNVNLEHRDFLGDTLPEIAVEKAGIIKPGVEVVSAADQPEVREVIDSKAGECNAKAFYLSRDFGYDVREDIFPRQWIDFRGPWGELKNVGINLPGAFQASNAAVALMALQTLQQKEIISQNEMLIRKGMADTKWPARLEKLSDSPFIILDCAHNPFAMNSMANSIRHLFKDRKIVLVVGMMSDKDVASSFRALRNLSDSIILTQAKYERAMPARKLAESARDIFDKVYQSDSIADAMEHAITIAEPDDLILITGSLFNVAEVREFADQKGLKPS